MNFLSKYIVSIFRRNTGALKFTSVSTKLWGKLYLQTAQEPLVPHSNTVQKLQELFNLKKITATNIILDHKKFTEVSANEIERNFNALISAGIKKDNLHKHVEVLTILEVDEKICLLKDLTYDLNNTVPLVMLDIKILSKFVIQEKTEDRLKFFAELFKLNINQVCAMLSMRLFLITLDLQHIKNCCDLLTNFGISTEEILKDLCVLKYSLKTIENRLKVAKDNNIEKIKTWMVRAPPVVFENSIKRKSDNKSILGKKSFIEYLSQKLQCTQELAKYIISKHPAIQNTSLKKINKIVDFLLCNGFNTVHVCRTPKILLHSSDTIKARLKVLEDQGTQLNSLTVLTKSKKQFLQFLDSHSSERCKKS